MGPIPRSVAVFTAMSAVALSLLILPALAQESSGAGSDSAGSTVASANPGPHSVALSWDVSAPANVWENSPTGFIIYRSTFSPVRPIRKNRIDCLFISFTTCVDVGVESGRTYYYVATSFVISDGHRLQSGPSNEIEVKVPTTTLPRPKPHQ